MHGTIRSTYCILKRHENGGTTIKIACGTKTLMLNVTFIKTTKKIRRLEKNKNQRERNEKGERGYRGKVKKGALVIKLLCTKKERKKE